MSSDNSKDFILSLKPGAELDELVTKSIAEFSDDVHFNWSTNETAALQLWDIMEGHIGTVGIIRVGADAPNIISQMASVGEGDEITTTYTSNWIESLCKAFLLYTYGYRGDFMHPEFEQKMREAPKRLRRVK